MAVAVIKGEKTLIELAQGFDVHRIQIKHWRARQGESVVPLHGSTCVHGREWGAKLSGSRQAILPGISRGSVYHQPRPADLKLMHRIDRLLTAFPFAGSRMLQGLLVEEGFAAACRHTDETDGDRGALSPTECLETGTRAQDLPRSAAKPGRNPTGFEQSTSPTFRWRAASSPSPLCWTGSPAASSPGACRSRWTRIFALKEALTPHAKPEIFNAG